MTPSRPGGAYRLARHITETTPSGIVAAAPVNIAPDGVGRRLADRATRADAV